MRYGLFLVALALVTLSFAGCLKSKDTVQIKLDGSGTIKATFEVDQAKFKELMATAAMLFESGNVPKEPPNILHKGWIEQDAKRAEGYKLTKYEQSVADGKQVTVIEGTFTTLHEAAKGGAFFDATVTLDKVEPGTGDEGDAPKTPAWKLTMRPVFAGPVEALGGMDASQLLPAFEAQVKSLSMKRAFTLPTNVLETNGTKGEDGKSVSWSVNYDRILEGKDLSMSVVFEASEDLKLKPFKYAPDLMRLLNRVGEKPPTGEKGGGKDEGGAEPQEGPKKPDDETKDGGK